MHEDLSCYFKLFLQASSEFQVSKFRLRAQSSSRSKN